MKTKFAATVGLFGTLLALGWLGVFGVSAQPPGHQLASGPVTTNWIGCLVVGGYTGTGPLAPMDPMPGLGPVPTAVRQVQLGLRSDGVVIWREATNPK